MADTPGKVLSSFSSNEKKDSSYRLGGCAGVFFQLLDRFSGRKLIPHKLLPSERPKQHIISHAEEKLPMAKLLLIADENRIGSSRRDCGSVPDHPLRPSENSEKKNGKRGVSVVAKLMGLETMPSPEPFYRERKQMEWCGNKKEAQSTKKLLQCKLLQVEKARKSTRPMDTRVQTLRSRMKEPYRDQYFDQIEDSPLRSILSPSNKLLSPIKSPLSAKNQARLFGAAVKVLEPSLHSARQLEFQCPSAKVKVGKKKTLGLGPSKASPMHLLTAPFDAINRNLDESSFLGSEQKDPSIESRGLQRSRRVAETSTKPAQCSPGFANRDKPPGRTQETVSHVKRPDKKLGGKGTEMALCRQEARTPFSVYGIEPYGKSKNSPTMGIQPVHCKSEAGIVVLHKKKDVDMKGLNQPMKSRSISIPPSPSVPRESHSPTKTLKSSKPASSSPQGSADSAAKAGSRSKSKVGSFSTATAENSCRSGSGVAGSQSLNSAHHRGISMPSISRSSQKRKASSLLVKPPLPTKGQAHCMESYAESGLHNTNYLYESHGNFHLHRYSTASAMRSLAEANSSSSVKAVLVHHTHPRARWDMDADERMTITEELCEQSAQFRSPDSSMRIHCTLATDSSPCPSSIYSGVENYGYASSRLPCCQGQSKHLYSQPSQSSKKQLDFSADSSFDHFLVDTQQVPRCLHNLSMGGDSSIRECESASELCAEEYGQPSPISILESPFQDSASSSSDSCEALQGRKENMKELFGRASTMASHMEEAFFSETMSNTYACDVVDATPQLPHCINVPCLTAGLKSNNHIQDEDSYVMEILGATLVSVKDAFWGGLALSGPLINMGLFYQLEDKVQHLDWAIETPLSRVEHVYGASTIRVRECKTSMSGCKEVALQRRKLLFDCTEEALRLSLETTGTLPSNTCLLRAQLFGSVCKQIDEWKGLASSMNLDDMTEKDINAGVNWWKALRNEAEKVAENLEAIIFGGLMDDLLKEAVVTGSASYTPGWG